MGDLLTQRDIDTLLQGSAGAPAPRPSRAVATYDFVRPGTVSRERRVTLDAIHDRLARGLELLLTARLRSATEVTVGGVEMVTLAEYLLSLETPCAAFAFKLGGRVTGLGVLDLGVSFAFHVVDRLFGGPGEDSMQDRALTTLEQSVSRGVAEPALASVADAWREHGELAPEIVAFESSPQMLEVASREEIMLVTTLEVRSGGYRGAITLALPTPAVEPWLAVRNVRRVGPNASTPEAVAARAALSGSLKLVRLTITARLPVLWLSTRSIADLREGQVIPTGEPVDTPVELHVNGKLRHLGTLGQLRRRVGLRITQTIVASDATGRARANPRRTR